jgi:hypothetical protein
LSEELKIGDTVRTKDGVGYKLRGIIKRIEKNLCHVDVFDGKEYNELIAAYKDLILDGHYLYHDYHEPSYFEIVVWNGKKISSGC